MREIKFRAFDKKSNRMKTGVESYLGAYLPPNGSIHDTHILMQYTGLKDKKGKEIYEGDIIKQKYNKSVHIYEVKWSNYGGYSDIYNANDKEVIGNIYENKDLLTQ